MLFIGKKRKKKDQSYSYPQMCSLGKFTISIISSHPIKYRGSYFGQLFNSVQVLIFLFVDYKGDIKSNIRSIAFFNWFYCDESL